MTGRLLWILTRISVGGYVLEELTPFGLHRCVKTGGGFSHPSGLVKEVR
jgi:hypothetical protein